jgi:hypothetical protein
MEIISNAALDKKVLEIDRRNEVKNKPHTIFATPYTWTEPAKIPVREWLYGRRLLRKFISLTVAQGGIGKSSLEISETLALVSGKALLGILPPRPLRVWLWNLEDPYEETARRIQAPPSGTT